jgi:hypothetical protein
MAAQSVSIAVQRVRILTALADSRAGLPMSALGCAAFPERRFRSPQGAALAVSRTVRGLFDDQLLKGASRGYEITQSGLAMATKLKSSV